MAAAPLPGAAPRNVVARGWVGGGWALVGAMPLVSALLGHPHAPSNRLCSLHSHACATHNSYRLIRHKAHLHSAGTNC